MLQIFLIDRLIDLNGHQYITRSLIAPISECLVFMCNLRMQPGWRVIIVSITGVIIYAAAWLDSAAESMNLKKIVSEAPLLRQVA